MVHAVGRDINLFTLTVRTLVCNTYGSREWAKLTNPVRLTDFTCASKTIYG